MGYEKNTWRSGDVVTAEKLNHMEDGIANAWPADLPKPSVGGYGYTEQGEQTVITWDGDTEGKAAVGGVYYHVSDNIFHWDDLVGATLVSPSGDETNFTAEFVEEMKTVFHDDNNDVVFVDFFACAIADGAEFTMEGHTLTFPEKGVYFSTAYGTGAMSLTYGTPDTIHKIDEKYLPSGGGGVFETFYNSATNTVDKTFAEIKEAYYAGKNVTLRTSGDVILQVSMMPMSDDDSDIVFSGLADIYIDTQAAELQSANAYQVIISSNESVQFEQGYFGF